MGWGCGGEGLSCGLCLTTDAFLAKKHCAQRKQRGTSVVPPKPSSSHRLPLTNDAACTSFGRGKATAHSDKLHLFLSNYLIIGPRTMSS